MPRTPNPSRAGSALIGSFARPALALITLLPLAWLLAVTVTAGVEKIGHPDPHIGFLAQARVLSREWPSLEQAVSAAKAGGDATAIEQAEQALRKNEVLRFNNRLDAVVALGFLVMVGAIVLLSVREWVLLLNRRKPPVLAETAPIWLPDYAIAESRSSVHIAGVALAFALAKELSGEAEMERAPNRSPCKCELRDTGAPPAIATAHARQAAARAYLEVAEKRFQGIKQCC